MKAGQFSAYINNATQHICLVKTSDDFEFQNNSYSPLCTGAAKKDALNIIQDYFEEHYIPDECRKIINQNIYQ